MTVRVELAAPLGVSVTLLGTSVSVKSKEKEERAIEPENPSMLARSILELSDPPGAAVSCVFSAVKVKSGPVTFIAIRAECDRLQPFDAVMLVV